MNNIQRYQSEEVLKLLGDPTRLAILRLLISKPGTISQLGETLGKHPAQIRNHLKQLEKIGMVRLDSVLNTKNYFEKFYRATARAFFVNMAVFPEPPVRGQIVILGSDDPALDLLALGLNQKAVDPFLYVLPVGSLEGLIYLREKYCQFVGCHLFDIESGTYNLPFVRLLFTDQTMVLVTLSHRQQGLLVQKGNPKNLVGITDLTRPGLTFVNRKRGTGTRLWLDQCLSKMNIDPVKINGFANEVPTHYAVASSIVSGSADVGLGIFAAAAQYQLDFIPLFEERYDLVMSEETFQSENVSSIMTYIQSDDIRRKIEKLGGYNTAHTGEVIRV